MAINWFVPEVATASMDEDLNGAGPIRFPRSNLRVAVAETIGRRVCHRTSGVPTSQPGRTAQSESAAPAHDAGEPGWDDVAYIHATLDAIIAASA